MTDIETARRLALLLLKSVDNPSNDLIAEKARGVCAMLIAQTEILGFSEDELVRDLQSRVNVFTGTAAILEGDGDHRPWLPDRRADIDWKFWHRYERFLEEEKDWAPSSIRRLGETTDEILGLLEDSQREGSWDRRGMVVGQVQSGKTSNYSALICKAADAGYRLIVVLAGMTNSLRSQTQLRLDESFVGWDTRLARAFDQSNRRMGVGLQTGTPLLRVHSGTNGENNGDFNRRVANQFSVLPGGNDPLILVVKKNKSVLQNLANWATAILGETDPETGRKVVRNVPLLLIDDEADNASVNTNPISIEEEEDRDPTAINGLIRRFLVAFDQRAYVGYTATPFANIFIEPDVDTQEHGQDLFPRDFIVSLPVSSNHVGPERVFGLVEDAEAGTRETEGLPIVRFVADHDDLIPDRHKSSLFVEQLPDSMLHALRTFVLCCAARRARGQVKVHNSMLVHVTRFIAVQEQIADMLGEGLSELQRRIRYERDDSRNGIHAELHDLWESDFVPTTNRVVELDSEIADETRVVEWPEVKAELNAAAQRIQIKRINGSAGDILDYWDYPDGLNVVAVGGDKLSRGLTLEDLSVSYFLRATKMYDTLLQMGRWFGYRPGFADLCRLYTTGELASWYQHITLASTELTQELEHMSATGGTPATFGLKVRTHPSGLVITSAGKMRSAVTMKVSYSGDISESVVFDRNQRIVDANFRHFDSFISDLKRDQGEPEPGDRAARLWRRIPGTRMAEFIEGIQTHESSRKAKSPLLARFIRRQLEQGELASWSLALTSVSANVRSGRSNEVGGYEIGFTERADQSPDDKSRYAIKRLVSPLDEQIDLNDGQVAEALSRTVELWNENRGRSRRTEPPEQASGKAIRTIRPKSEGLLLVYPVVPSDSKQQTPYMGFAVSFPESDTAQSIEYAVDSVYVREELGVT